MAVGVITAAGLMLDTVEVSALGAGAFMVLTATGVEAEEVWESWVKDCCELRRVRRRAGKLFCVKRNTFISFFHSVIRFCHYDKVSALPLETGSGRVGEMTLTPSAGDS